MGRNLTPDESRQQILDEFPPGVGELFYEISTSVAHLHLNWNSYRSLYGTSAERIELLNWAASTFFGLLDGILFHDVILAIARLMDPPRYRDYDRASLERLIEVLRPFLDTTMVDRLQERLQELRTLCQPIRDIRNRVLAHEDLATALNYHPDPLPGISRAYIEDVLEQIRGFLNDTEEHFRGLTTSYQDTWALAGGEALIRALESAREHEECRERDFRKQYGLDANDG
jgi:hypothetical protein